MTDAEKKQRRDMAIVTFNVGFMVVMLSTWQVLGRGFFLSAAAAFLVAGVAAGVAWKMKSR
jgi:hypothetical protein